MKKFLHHNEVFQSLPNKAIFLFGPTASGKSEILSNIDLPNIELINADSQQVYRGLDIGTAKSKNKPAVQHLIDICNPDEQFTIAEFVQQARNYIEEVCNRGGIPIVAGGCAYYFKHLLYGLPETPASNPVIRAELEERCKKQGLESLRSELKQVDLSSYNRIQAGDAYRIIRALEVYKTSGRALSNFRIPTRPTKDLKTLIFGLRVERNELYDRINRRVEQIFARGLIDEVRRLLVSGYRPDHPGMQAIGYKECFAQGLQEQILAGEPLTDEVKKKLISSIQQNTRRYAKRQITFFKSLPAVTWIDLDYSRNSQNTRSIIESKEESAIGRNLEQVSEFLKLQIESFFGN